MTSLAHDNVSAFQSNYDPNFLSDEEEEYCPLCIEPLDITDKNFFPCPCGYQICQFCYNNIRQNPELNGRCPACRRKYDDESVRYVVLSPEELKIERANLARKERERKQKEKERKDSEFSNRKHLAGMRVIQKNLVYVVGINPPVPYEDVSTVLKSEKYFGQYGKINKIVVNKKNPHSNDNYHHHSPGYGVYITFATKDDASKCISKVDGTYMDGRLIKAAYGTTKYCSSYLRGLPCPNPNCMFLHEPGEEADSFNRKELHNKQQAQQQLPNGLSHSSIHSGFKSGSSVLSSSSHNANGLSSLNQTSNANSPVSIKTNLHNNENSSSATPVLTPAHVPVGANPWGISQSSTPITSLNLSKTSSSNNLPTLGDSLNLHGPSSQVQPDSHSTTVENKASNSSTSTTHTTNTSSKKKNVSVEKQYIDPYDALASAAKFFDQTLHNLSNYEKRSLSLKSNLLDDDEYNSYPSLFSWENIKTAKKSENILSKKLVDILATKPIDYSASVIDFLQSVNAGGTPANANISTNLSPIGNEVNPNDNTGSSQVQNAQIQQLQQQQQQQQPLNISTPPPPGIYPIPSHQPQPQHSQIPENGSTNSTDLLNQLIKGRKVIAGN